MNNSSIMKLEHKYSRHHRFTLLKNNKSLTNYIMPSKPKSKTIEYSSNSPSKISIELDAHISPSINSHESCNNWNYCPRSTTLNYWLENISTTEIPRKLIMLNFVMMQTMSKKCSKESSLVSNITKRKLTLMKITSMIKKASILYLHSSLARNYRTTSRIFSR